MEWALRYADYIKNRGEDSNKNHKVRTTLFNVGDTVKIRADIKDMYYDMRINDNKMDYLSDEMAPPNTLVTIRKIQKTKEGEVTGYLMEEPYDFYTYTDDMFDQDTVNYLWYTLTGE